MINAEVEQKLRSHVLGAWLDNGFNNWFSTKKPLESLADLKGMKIRNSGSAGSPGGRSFSADRERDALAECAAGTGAGDVRRVDFLR